MTGGKQKFSDFSILKIILSLPIFSVGVLMIWFVATDFDREKIGTMILLALGGLAIIVVAYSFAFTWSTRILDLTKRQWMMKSRGYFGTKTRSGSFEEIQHISLKKKVHTSHQGTWTSFDVDLKIEEEDLMIPIKSTLKLEQSREFAEEIALYIGVDAVDYTVRDKKD